MVKEGEKHSSNKLLVGILVVLVFVIVGLAVGIFAVWMNKNSDGSQQGITGDGAPRNPVSLPSEMYDKADGILADGGSNAYNEAMACFDNAISSASDHDMIFELNSMRVFILIKYGYFEDAINYVRDMEQEELDIFERYNIYGFYKMIYEGLGDLEKADEYEKLLQITNDEINSLINEEQEGEND